MRVAQRKKNEYRSNLMFHTQSTSRITPGRAKTENWQKLDKSDWGAPCIARSCSRPSGRWLWWAAAACSERMVQPCTRQCPPWPTSSARLKMLKKTGECSMSCTGWVECLSGHKWCCFLGESCGLSDSKGVEETELSVVLCVIFLVLFLSFYTNFGERDFQEIVIACFPCLFSCKCLFVSA